MGYSLYAELKRRVKGSGGGGWGVGWSGGGIGVGWYEGGMEGVRGVEEGRGRAEGGDSRLFSRPRSPG